MSIGEWLLLLAAGLLGGVINSVSSGGSFFTYPALLLTGLSPLSAATTTLAALTPGNLAAVPEFWPEVKAERHRYPTELSIVFVGGLVGIALLLATGADLFEVWCHGSFWPLRDSSPSAQMCADGQYGRRLRSPTDGSALRSCSSSPCT